MSLMKIIGIAGVVLAVLFAFLSHEMGTHYESQTQNHSKKVKRQQAANQRLQRKIRAEVGPNRPVPKVLSYPVSAKGLSSSEAIWIGCNRAKFKVVIAGFAFACLMFLIDSRTKRAEIKNRKSVPKTVKIDIQDGF